MGNREALNDRKVTHELETILLFTAGVPDTHLLHALVVRIAGQDEKGLAVSRELGAHQGLLVAGRF